MKMKELLERPEIAKAVYDKYPVTKKERQGCETEKAHNNGLRFNLAKRIYEQQKEKKEYR